MVGAAGANGAFHDDLTPAWDHLFRTNRAVVDTINGEHIDPTLDLPACIRAIHTAAVEIHQAIFTPDALVAMFDQFPSGAFAFRLGTTGFADDVKAIWQACSDALRARYAAWPNPVEFEIVRFGGENVGPEHLPPALWPFVKDTSERMGVATSSVALSAVVACSSVIHDDWTVQPKRLDTEWVEQARLWGAIVGPPSVLKSPVIRACTAPVDALEVVARERWGQDMALWRVAHKAWKAASRADADTAGPEPLAPHCARYLIEDTTVAAMTEVLRSEKDTDGKLWAAQRKVLVRADELSELLASMDDTQNGKGRADRGAYLRLYNGGRFNVDRIIRGAFVVPNWSACLLGGIQPQPIQRIADRADNDGLLQRFMFSVPPASGDGTDRRPDYVALHGYRDLFPALASLRPTVWSDTNKPEIVRLHSDAHAAREDIEKLKNEVIMMDASPRVQSAAGKFPGLFARLCLTFHLIELAAIRVRDPNQSLGLWPLPNIITADTAERVRRYMREILTPHLLRADAVMFNTPDTDHAGWVAGFILARKLDRVTIREIVQDHRALRPPEKRQTLHSIMDSLEIFGWLQAEEPTNLAKPPTGWTVNPRVHLAFAERAKVERERRAVIREMLDARAAEARRRQDGANP